MAWRLSWDIHLARVGSAGRGAACGRRRSPHLQRAQRFIHVAADREVVDRDVLQDPLQVERRPWWGVAEDSGSAAHARPSPSTAHAGRPLHALARVQRGQGHRRVMQRCHGGVCMICAPFSPSPPPQTTCTHAHTTTTPPHLGVDDVEAAQRDACVPLQNAVLGGHRLGHVRQDGDLQAAWAVGGGWAAAGRWLGSGRAVAARTFGFKASTAAGYG